MRTLKFLLLLALFLFVGIPCLFVLFVTGMAMVAMLLVVVKIALLIIVPIAIVMWLIRR